MDMLVLKPGQLVVPFDVVRQDENGVVLVPTRNEKGEMVQMLVRIDFELTNEAGVPLGLRRALESACERACIEIAKIQADLDQKNQKTVPVPEEKKP